MRENVNHANKKDISAGVRVLLFRGHMTRLKNEKAQRDRQSDYSIASGRGIIGPIIVVKSLSSKKIKELKK